jgi:prephenate dehydrogenase
VVLLGIIATFYSIGYQRTEDQAFVMRILVVGAGIGGLCLAQGLRKAGIDVQIFEKQVSRAQLLVLTSSSVTHPMSTADFH